MIQWVTSDEDGSHPTGCPPLIAEPLVVIKKNEPKIVFNSSSLSKIVWMQRQKRGLENPGF